MFFAIFVFGALLLLAIMWLAIRTAPGPHGIGSTATTLQVMVHAVHASSPRDSAGAIDAARGAAGATLLAGRVAVVTGAGSGIGTETAAALVALGARVHAPCRNAARARETRDAVVARAHELRAAALLDAAVERALEDPDTLLVTGVANLADLGAVDQYARAIAARETWFDIVICNAGIMALPERRPTTDGLESQMAVNHLSHFALVERLAGENRFGTGTGPSAARGCRLVMVSSGAHGWASRDAWIESPTLESDNYSRFTSYGNSKLANAIFARGAHLKWHGSGQFAALSLHPGVIATNLVAEYPKWFQGLVHMIAPVAVALRTMRSIEQGAATTVFAAIHPAAWNLSGSYLAGCAPSPMRCSITRHMTDTLEATSRRLVAGALRGK
jgi:NAD(P)-dependent dehydrogenase (short-subunit alcohol dehydrogenase family)